MGPIVVEVTRGDVVEARHRAHAVAMLGGELVAQAGDASLVTYSAAARSPSRRSRSSGRGPIPQTRSSRSPARRTGRGPGRSRPCAICSRRRRRPGTTSRAAARPRASSTTARASTRGCSRSARRRADRRRASSGRSTPARGRCSPKPTPPTVPAESVSSEHPGQRTMLAEVAAAAGVAPNEIPTATDGCGVVTVALPLERMAYALAELRGRTAPSASQPVSAYPGLVRGPGAADTVLMRARSGVIATGGAEGCSAPPRRTGSGSRSRWRTAPGDRSAPRWPRSWRLSAPRAPRSSARPSRARGVRWSATPGSADRALRAPLPHLAWSV